MLDNDAANEGSVRADLIEAFKANDQGEHPDAPKPGDDEGYHETNPMAGKAAEDGDEAAKAAATDDKPAAKTHDDATDDNAADKAAKDEPKDAGDTALEPPVKWTKDEKATWDALRELGGEEHANQIVQAQKILFSRNKQLEGAFTKRMQELATERRDFEGTAAKFSALDEVIAPYREDYARLGVDDAAMLRQTLAIEKQAREQPAEFAQWFVQRQGWSHDQIAQMFGVQTAAPDKEVVVVDQDGNILYQGKDTSQPSQPQQPQQQPQQSYQMPPELQNQFSAMTQRLQQLEGGFGQFASQQGHQAAESAKGVLHEFAGATDTAGNALFPFYEDVRSDMAAIMEANGNYTIEQAYHAAVGANSELAQKTWDSRELAMKRQFEQQQTKEASEARRAGASLPTSSLSVPAPAQGDDQRGLRDEITHNMKQFMSGERARV